MRDLKLGFFHTSNNETNSREMEMIAAVRTSASCDLDLKGAFCDEIRCRSSFSPSTRFNVTGSFIGGWWSRARQDLTALNHYDKEDDSQGFMVIESEDVQEGHVAVRIRISPEFQPRDNVAIYRLNS
jgi:hypothetical protein